MNIGIVGLGLIGGSIALAAKKYTQHTVYGTDKNKEVTLQAKQCGAIDFVLTEENASCCDLLIFAIVPKQVFLELEKFLPLLKDGAIVSDICGVKRELCKIFFELSKKYPKINFISAHPMAGKEKSGFENSSAELFKGSFVITVDVANKELSKSKAVGDFYLSLGAVGIENTTAEFHDKIISYTSQLAHIVSASYIQNPLSEKHCGYSAGSFADMTRVARLNPKMWTELCLENRDNLTLRIEELINSLDQFKKALEQNDENALKKLFEASLKAKELSEKLYCERLDNENKG